MINLCKLVKKGIRFHCVLHINIGYILVIKNITYDYAVIL